MESGQEKDVELHDGFSEVVVLLMVVVGVVVVVVGLVFLGVVEFYCSGVGFLYGGR